MIRAAAVPGLTSMHPFPVNICVNKPTPGESSIPGWRLYSFFFFGKLQQFPKQMLKKLFWCLELKGLLPLLTVGVTSQVLH